MSEQINKLFIKFAKRAEKHDRQTLLHSFVDVGPLFTTLAVPDNQIIYGRRGTGKTHALVYLSEDVRSRGDISVYVDLRNIGSTGGIYSDNNIDVSERATRLLMDTLAAVHEELLNVSVEDSRGLNLSMIGPVLDELAQAITEVVVKGSIEHELVERHEEKSAQKDGSQVVVSGNPGFCINDEQNTEKQESNDSRLRQQGIMVHRVHFGRVGTIFEKLCKCLEGKRLWVMLDEWSAIPIELQPYLADLLRRSIFPVSLVTVKIGAIEKRSKFQIAHAGGDYIGIELGADASADLNMDDLMVFDNDERKAVRFFRKLIYLHASSIAKQEQIVIPSEENFFNEAFTQDNVFLELVRAAEGIPRDAFYILSLSAQRDVNDTISMDTIRKCSKTWYQRDKEAAVSANQKALQLLHWIIDKVIAYRRARAFLLGRNVSHELIDTLFDARVLHLLKKNISAHDQPGARYDVYKIDYGCYVDLLSTARSPKGLLEVSENKYVEVPTDDYRAIRRAILDVDEFEKHVSGQIRA